MVRLMHENMRYSANDLVPKISIPTVVTKQGSRVVYQMNLMFRQVANLFNHQPMETSKRKKDENIPAVDLNTIRNRFVRKDKVDEITAYVKENLDEYILPPISGLTERYFGFQPYNHYEVLEVMGEEYDLVNHPEKIVEVLDYFDGMLQGMLIVKETEFNCQIIDGNHRTASIHALNTEGEPFKSLRIGVQIFHENDMERQRQAFVDLNTSTPIDKTLLTLFGNRDPLSVLAKECASSLEECNASSPDYIGFDSLSDSISKSSTSVLTLNMIKNMMIRFALGEGGTKKKFTKLYHPGSADSVDLVRDFSAYMKAIFGTFEVFSRIKEEGVNRVPHYREENIALTGAGLYLLANVGHLAVENGISFEEAAERLHGIDWKRKTILPDGTVRYNPLFRSGILNESGSISNNRSAEKSTLEAVAAAIGLANL